MEDKYKAILADTLKELPDYCEAQYKLNDKCIHCREFGLDIGAIIGSLFSKHNVNFPEFLEKEVAGYKFIKNPDFKHDDEAVKKQIEDMLIRFIANR